MSSKIVKPRTVYEQEKPALEMRRAYYKAQNEMMDYWDRKYKEMLKEIKRDIEEVLQ